MSREIRSFSDHFSAWFKKLLRHDWEKKHKKMKQETASSEHSFDGYDFVATKNTPQ